MQTLWVWRLLDTILYDKVCQWHAAGLWFSLGTPVSSTNKTDCHDIAEILLKVALNTITLSKYWQGNQNFTIWMGVGQFHWNKAKMFPVLFHLVWWTLRTSLLVIQNNFEIIRISLKINCYNFYGKVCIIETIYLFICFKY